MDDWSRRRGSFGRAADVYDRARPGYAPQALRWAIGDQPREVLDLGAGTGILTRQLVRLGHRVTAVEPDADMLATLRAAAPPEVRAVAGAAEAIPLPDASVDAVVAGQSYHWFDPSAAHDEIARVLRPGGTFAPLWNLRDEAVAWVRDLSRILTGEDGNRSAGVGYDSFGPRFTRPDRTTFRHAVRYTADSLVELVRSRSYYLTASAERQADLERHVRQLVGSHPDLAGRAEFELPYETVVYRAGKLS